MNRRLFALACAVLPLLGLMGCENDLTRAIGGVKVIHEFADTFSTQSSGDVISDGQNILVTYYDVDTSDLAAIQSADGGETWGTPVTIDSSGITGQSSKLSRSGTSTLVLYSDGSGKSHWAESMDGGATWPNKGAITSPDPNAYNVNYFWIGTSLACTYFYWDSGSSSTRIAAKSSADRGGVWAGPYTIDSYTASQLYAGESAACVIDAGRILVLFAYGSASGSGLRRSYCTAGLGSAWAAAAGLSGPGEVAHSVSAASSGLSVSVSYWDQTAGRLMFTSSGDGGMTVWSQPVKVSAVGSSHALKLGRWTVLLHSSPYSTGTLDGALETSTDAGLTWSTHAIPVAGSSCVPLGHTVDSTAIYVLMQQLQANGTPNRKNLLYLARSDTGGATWF